MAIKPVMRFVGTGKPMNAGVNPRIKREASQKGVERSGVASKGEFNSVVNRENQPSNHELGRRATDIMHSPGLDLLA